MSSQRIFVARNEDNVRSRTIKTGRSVRNNNPGCVMPETQDDRFRKVTEDSAIPPYNQRPGFNFQTRWKDQTQNVRRRLLSNAPRYNAAIPRDTAGLFFSPTKEAPE